MRLSNYLNEQNFSSIEDVKNWIQTKSKEYGSKNKFYSSDEYKEAYPQIKKIYNKAKKKQRQQSKEVELLWDKEENGYVLKYIDSNNAYVAHIPKPNKKDNFGVVPMLTGGKSVFKTKKDARQYANQYKLKITR